MKIFVLTKKRLLAVAMLFILCLGFVPSIFKTVSTSVTTRELPIYSVETPEKKIAVTFDSAWNDNDIDKIIEQLELYSCPSTFFVTGDWAERFPNSLIKLFNAGHEIASHSYNHTLYSTLSKDEIISDMKKCDDAIENIIGQRPNLVRNPSGDYTNNSILAAKETNRYTIQWDVDSLDWKGLSQEDMLKRIYDRIGNGSILLFHNGTTQTADCIGNILKSLKDNGYTFVKVSDLICKENFYIDHTGRQFPNGT